MNKPGSIFGSYGSQNLTDEIDERITEDKDISIEVNSGLVSKPMSIMGDLDPQGPVIEIDEDTTIEILEEEDDELSVEVEDRVHFVDDYEKLKNLPTLNGVQIIGNKTSEDYGISGGGGGDAPGPARPNKLGSVKAEILDGEKSNAVDAQIDMTDSHLYVEAVAYGKQQALTNEEKETGRDNIDAVCTRDKIYDTEIDQLFN